MLEKKLEPALNEVGAIAVQVVAAKLVDDNDDDQLGMASVGGAGDGGKHWCRGQTHQEHSAKERTRESGWHRVASIQGARLYEAPDQLLDLPVKEARRAQHLGARAGNFERVRCVRG